MSKTVVITGAGAGIGRAIAENLAERDCSTILLGRQEENLETTRRGLKNPDQHQTFPCDVRRPEDLKQVLQKSGAGSLYGVVVNAGVGGENMSPNGDRWEEIIDTNLSGSYYTVKECLPWLRQDAAEFRKIVFVSSILARLGVPGYSAYCASKAGMLGLMRSLAAELARENILVNALLPGWVNTQMAHDGIQGFADKLNISKEEAYNNAMQQVPLGKMSEPGEIAAMVAFLLDDAQTSITGQSLDINNGAMMP